MYLARSAADAGGIGETPPRGGGASDNIDAEAEGVCIGPDDEGTPTLSVAVVLLVPLATLSLFALVFEVDSSRFPYSSRFPWLKLLDLDFRLAPPVELLRPRNGAFILSQLDIPFFECLSFSSPPMLGACLSFSAPTSSQSPASCPDMPLERLAREDVVEIGIESVSETWLVRRASASGGCSVEPGAGEGESNETGVSGDGSPTSGVNMLLEGGEGVGREERDEWVFTCESVIRYELGGRSSSSVSSITGIWRWGVVMVGSSSASKPYKLSV